MKEKKKVYKFIETENVNIQTTLRGYTFSNEWLDINKKGLLLIKGTNKKGYAWDGCTPKWEWKDLVMGTPDGRLDHNTGRPITYYASMAHDIIYQFSKDIGLTRKEADLLFRDILKAADFYWTKVYYSSVRALGWKYWNKYSK